METARHLQWLNVVTIMFPFRLNKNVIKPNSVVIIIYIVQTKNTTIKTAIKRKRQNKTNK